MRPDVEAERVPGETTAQFRAFERPDGTVGVRNTVLVLPSVICSHIVADRIAETVPNAVSAPHDHGCAQLGSDNEQTRRTFLGIATNPNVAGTLVVGLGCEELQSAEIAADLEARGTPVRELAIQKEGGSDRTVERGIEQATDLATDLADRETTADLGQLTVGIVSSDVQGSTVDSADPLVGELVRHVVDAGGRVVVGGVERLLPHVEEALETTTRKATRAKLAELLDERGRTPTRTAGLRGRAATRPFEELTRSWGGLPLEDVLAYGETAGHDAGVAFVDTPSAFAEAATGLAAAGAHLIVHVTADGIPSGHPIVPVIKVTGNGETYAALEGDIDVDATTTTESELIDYVRQVADGQPSCAERHGLTEFAITRIGPSM